MEPKEGVMTEDERYPLNATRGGVLLEYALFILPFVALSLATIDAYEVMHSYRVLGDALQLAGRDLATLDSRWASRAPDNRPAYFRWRIYPVIDEGPTARTLDQYLGSPRVDLTLRPEYSVPTECSAPGTGFVCSREFVSLEGAPTSERVTYDMNAVFRDRLAQEIRASLPPADTTEGCGGSRCIVPKVQRVRLGEQEALSLSLTYTLPLRILGNRPIQVTRVRVEPLEQSHIDRHAQYRIFNCSFTGRSEYSDCREEE